MKIKRKIKLGQYVKDEITGFEGVAVSITEWMNGCRRIGIQSKEMHEGKPIEIEWVDEKQVAKVKPGRIKQVAATGGPRQDPKR